MPNTICECGHRKEEHRGGENCEFCTCKAFTPAINYTCTCTECGQPATDEICTECQKIITDNCPGDLLNYLFGIKSDYPAIDKVKAKRLAMDIRDAGMDVRQLWSFWKS